MPNLPASSYPSQAKIMCGFLNQAAMFLLIKESKIKGNYLITSLYITRESSIIQYLND